MKTWKDLLDVPIITLKDGVKNFVEISFNYWAQWLEENAPEKPEPTAEAATEEEDAAPQVASDLATVIANNKAIAEKYQSSGTESLLNHLAAQLATVRHCEKEDVLEEIKTALYIPDDKKALLGMRVGERAEHLAIETVSNHTDLVQRVGAGDKTAMKELDKIVIQGSYGLVEDKDLKVALRHILRLELAKKTEEPDAEETESEEA